MSRNQVEKIISQILNCETKPGIQKIPKSNEEHNTAVNDLDGTVEVVNGRIIVTNPTGIGNYPTISPGPGVNLFINKKLLTSREMITEETEIEVILEDEPPYSDFEINLSDDEIEAYCTVNIRYGRKYSLVDQAKSKHLILKAEVTEKIIPQIFGLDEIQEKLTSMGITYGVELNEIQRELESPTGKPILVARGVPPIPSQDGFIKYLFIDEQKIYKTVSENQRINYLEQEQFQSVEIGTVLAVKYPPVRGKAGINVFGKEVLPEEPKDCDISVGEGVALVCQDSKAVATRTGRPVLREFDKTINILPQLDISGDVDIKTGNIRFNGDVLISGNVLEGLLVKATGRVTVLGSIYSARVMAEQDIIVHKNVMGSILTAGGSSAFFNRILPVLKQLLEDIEGIKSSVEQLKQNPKFLMQDLNIKGDGNLIKLLIDIKFKDIPHRVEQLHNAIDSIDYEVEQILKDFTEVLKSRFTGLGPLNIKSIDEVDHIIIQLHEIIDLGERNKETISNVAIRYVQNSVIEATGSISIFGQGSYQSKIYAGNEVSIATICRGGEIKAVGNITLGSLGSNIAVLTTAETSENATITAKQIFPNAVLKVGQHTYKAKQLLQSIRCYWEKGRGLLLVSNSNI